MYGILCKPDQDKVVTADEGMNLLFPLMLSIDLN